MGREREKERNEEGHKVKRKKRRKKEYGKIKRGKGKAGEGGGEERKIMQMKGKVHRRPRRRTIKKKRQEAKRRQKEHSIRDYGSRERNNVGAKDENHIRSRK